jgi:hypothetical protein
VTGGHDLVQDERLTIVTEAPPEISIVVKELNQASGFLEIKGTLWWDRGSSITGDSGRVRVTVESSDGALLTQSDAVPHPVFVRKGVQRRARFSARVSNPVGERVTVRLEFHPCARHDSRSEDCLLALTGTNGDSHE